MSTSRVIAEALGVATVVTLARLIPPAEFGRAAVAVLVLSVAIILGPYGLTAVLVQRPVLERREVESAAFLCVFLGILLTIGTFLFAWAGPAESVFGERTAELIALASPAWLLAGVGGVPQALVQRELRFRRMAVIDTVPTAVGTLVAISLAVRGVDGPALVAGGLAYLGSSSLIALVSVPPVLPRPSSSGIRGLSGFATPVTLSSLVFIGFRHVDYVILSARLPAEQVGYFWRAYQLGVEYQGKLSQIMMRVSFPVYSRSIDVEELKGLRLRIVRIHAALIIPSLAAFIAVAPTLIPWVFGSAWEPAVRPAQIMAIAGMAEGVMTGIGPLMTALGKPGLLLRWNLGLLAIYTAMIALLVPYGLIWISVGVAALGVVWVLAMQALLMPRLLGLGLRDLWRDIRAGFVTGLAVVVGLFGLRLLLETKELSAFPQLVVLGFAGLAIYGIVLRLLFQDVWADLLGIFRHKGAIDAPVVRRPN